MNLVVAARQASGQSISQTTAALLGFTTKFREFCFFVFFRERIDPKKMKKKIIHCEQQLSGDKFQADVRGQNLKLTDWLEAVNRQQEGTAGYIQILQSCTTEHITLKQFGNNI